MTARVPELRYRLAIVAQTPLAVVQHISGWVFDQVMGGWDATVFVVEAADPRPLRILGANMIELPCSAAPSPSGARPHAVAMAVDLFEADKRIHKSVLTTLTGGQSDLTFWGPSQPVELGQRIAPTDYRPSLAAQAFKARALAAAGLDHPAESIEILYTRPPATSRQQVRNSSRRTTPPAHARAGQPH